VWTQQGSKLVGADASSSSEVGWSVALSADGRSTAILGGPSDNSSLGAAWVFTAPPPPKPKTTTHDFNGDGMSDITLRDVRRGNTAIWLMNGAAVLSSGELGGAPNSWSMVGQRDFDGDGKADLLWLDNQGNAAIWFMNGTQVASTGSLGNVAGWVVVGTGDFDGDGMSDILWQDTSGNVAIWEMNGTSILNANNSFVATVPSPWSIQLTGDFNGDGMSDILWQDTLGNTIMWFMNGTVGTAGAVGNIPTNWVVQSVNAE